MNIIIFGPNGSGKGTQGAIVQKKYNIAHIESGVIFRENIKNETNLGKRAKEFIDRGDLVPDEITIPMILTKLKEDSCKDGWLLDGFPRNREQAKALDETLRGEGIKLDYIIEIILSREIAKKRIMGRKLCENDANHPNNIYIDNIKPRRVNDEYICRVCGGKLSSRSDDQDESAIDKRHNIYYDEKSGTLAAVLYYKHLSETNKGVPAIIEVDGEPPVDEVSENLLSKLK